jgi:RNA polymerase sigma-70 factor (ECF subfamily)
VASDRSGAQPRRTAARDAALAAAAAGGVTSRDALDRADLAAVVAGDRLALGRLYDRHREPMFGYVLRTTGWDRGLAEEVLQDTLMAVWQHAGSFGGQSQVRTWMYSIARRKALSKLRTRRPDPVDPVSARPVADDGPGPGDDALARLDLHVLSRLIDELPEAMRSVLVLAFIDDLPYHEISAIMDIPAGTIKSRVSRARAALAERATKEGLR